MTSFATNPPPHSARSLPRGVRYLFTLGMLATAMLWASRSLAVPRIAAVEVRYGATDLGPQGLNIGKSGYWFASFANVEPTRGAAPHEHAANQLPAWILVDFDPTSDPDSPPYSFSLTPGPSGPDATATGGIPGYNRLTLPDGRTGLSGQLVDAGVGNGGNSTLIKTWEFGPGAPTSLLVHVVLDNAPLSAGTAVDRLRITHTNAEGGIKDRASFDELSDRHDGLADVYTFRLEGIEVGGSFAVQLAALKDGSNQDTALGGLAFDALEFPPPAPVSLDRRWLLLPLATLLLAAGWLAGRYSRRSLPPTRGAL